MELLVLYHHIIIFLLLASGSSPVLASCLPVCAAVARISALPWSVSRVSLFFFHYHCAINFACVFFFLPQLFCTTNQYNNRSLYYTVCWASSCGSTARKKKSVLLSIPLTLSCCCWLVVTDWRWRWRSLSPPGLFLLS